MDTSIRVLYSISYMQLMCILLEHYMETPTLSPTEKMSKGWL